MVFECFKFFEIMADDIDSLLDDIEADLNKREKKRIPVQTHRSISNEVSDILELTSDAEEDTIAPRSAGQVKTIRGGSPGQPVKCQPSVMLGGSLCSSGLSTSLKPRYALSTKLVNVNRFIHVRSCDALFCLDCDFKISTFDDFKWDRSTDYLFLRNNMPDFARLKAKLVKAKGHRSYACQCRHLHLDQVTTLDQLNSALVKNKEPVLKWICTKHLFSS